MTRDEAIKASVEYFNGDELAASVFVDKYALKDEDGNVYERTPDDMHRRLAKEIARIESKYPNPISEEEIYESFKNFEKIVPQGSPMAGVGNEHQLMSVSNCFVIGSPEDSYGGILKSDEEIAQLAKRRAGIGLDISNIRPKGIPTRNAARTTDGISVFMSRFSNTCREVAQNGRRGACLVSISVHHPEVETFINIKRDKTKVTGANISVKLTEEFMTAVKNDTTYEQRWPINSSNPKVKNTVSARKIWDLIIDGAWESAEPGLLFWDHVQKNTPSDIYEEYKSISTNPCMVGDTNVYVADGRGIVSIKELADVGEDVDVFCYDNENNVTIRKMRNPRVTGYSEKIYKVTFDDGNFVRVTGNHKFLLKAGEYKETKDLQFNDQLETLIRFEDSIAYKYDKKGKNFSKYYWLENNGKNFTEHRVIAEHAHGNITGKVIHHKDFNSKNNNPENLLPMTREDHDRYHGDMMRGDRNPMRRAATEWSPEKIKEYSENMSKITTGLGNGNSYKITNDDIKEHAIKLTMKNGRRFSRDEWITYAEENSLPKNFSEYRKTDEYSTILELSLLAANLCGFDDDDHDTRLLRTRQSAEEQGYVTKIEDSLVYVLKTCEKCSKQFWVSYYQREQSFCSIDCSLEYINESKEIQEKRIASVNNAYEQKQNKNKIKILDEYTSLKAELGRDPMLKELETRCKQNKVAIRLNTKYGFENFKAIKDAALYHNHRVISVELDGIEDVYNGTVDDFHNFFVGGFDVHDNRNSKIFLNNLQCGEIVLSKNDSCRLTAMNILGFVKNKYTKDAYFDWEEFHKYAKLGQKIMDDIVDIEIEQIDKILKKIDSDPESDEIKYRERNLWNGIKTACSRGRRTGLGLTALGDSLAALGITYGSKESIEMTEKIYRALSLAAYETSIEMARDRGSFEVFDYEKEHNHPFISRVVSNLPDEYREMYKKYGRRNIALTTTAPAGSVSLMTQTSSGIEPVFMLSYSRRKKINPSENIEPDYIDTVGDKWTTYKVYHHELKNWMEVTGETDETKSPWFGGTAQDIDWSASVELQAAAQKWVCHSISKTCNLPNSASKELVSEVYMKAWETGCKGFTVYRDGCRDGVLITDSKKKEPTKFEQKDAPKRPEILDCDIHHIKVKGDNWIVFIGLYEGKPYETFAGLSKFVSIPKKVTKGTLIKHNAKKSNGSSIYDISFGDDADPVVIKDIVKTFENADEGAFTRLVSLALRHGTPIQFLTEQLQKEDSGEFNSFGKIIARVLKGYVKDGVTAKQKCPNCGSEGTMKYQEGCLICTNCGVGKC